MFNYMEGVDKKEIKKSQENNSTNFFHAEVVKIEEGTFYLKTKDSILKASKSFSCFIEPALGDLVLGCFLDNGKVFILSILDRRQKQGAKVYVPCNLDIASKGAVKISSGKGIKCMSDSIAVCGNDIALCGSRISLIGGLLKRQFSKIKSVAREVEEFFVHFIRHSKTSQKYIKEHNEVQSGTSRYLTEKTSTVQAKDSIHLIENLLNMNAKQINLG
ncbi:hypothetical protein JCM13304A_18180 [Desulfothermus okinawensis JCM 13304]